MINDEYLKNKLLTKTNKLNSKAIKKLTTDEIDYINNRYNDSLSFNESVKRIILNIQEHPVCQICGKPVVWMGKIKYLWTNTCLDKNCVTKIRLLHTTQTNLQKYGSAYAFQAESVKDKCKQTKLNKYGDEYWSNPEKTSETWNKKTEEEKQIIKNKTINTCLERYGVVNGGGSAESIKKIKETFLKNYGVESCFLSEIIKEKSKQTCLAKYGKEKYQYTDEFKQHISAKMSSEECLNKRKETNFNRHFSYTYNNKDQHISTCLTYYGVPYYNNQEKRNQTMKERGTFNKSKPEDDCYDILKEKYPDVIRQYKDSRYPFNCDFYIPSLDLFIEYQGSQYHQGHPFDKNDENDIIKLNILKENANNSIRKNQGKKSQYDNMIYVWTDLDVRKRNIAKNNNLNYIELWNIKEISNFV